MAAGDEDMPSYWSIKNSVWSQPITYAEVTNEKYRVLKQALSGWESEWVGSHHLEQDRTQGVGLGYVAMPAGVKTCTEVRHPDLTNENIGHLVKFQLHVNSE